MEPHGSRPSASGFTNLIKKTSPELVPKTWYGMPAYAREGKGRLLSSATRRSSRERYAMFGFNDSANLDESHMWPVAFALTELTPEVEEARIAALPEAER